MKSSLDGRPSAFSDSSLGAVCLFLFVDCSSWPNLTAACAAQVAKARTPTWIHILARQMSLPKQRLGDYLSAFVPV